MASAGRILIMPKGNYNPSATYEMLDLVYYNGASWIAKKTVTGIEPSAANDEYWQRVSEESHKVAFKTMVVDCVEGNTEYEFDLSEFSGFTIIGAIHQLGYPLESWEVGDATIHPKNHSQGVIHTSVANRVYVYCVVFYK